MVQDFAKTVVCRQCGGANVELAMWVEINDTRVEDGEEIGPINEAFADFDSDSGSWCRDCQEHGTLVFGGDYIRESLAGADWKPALSAFSEFF